MKHIFNICLLILLGAATTSYADFTISDDLLGLNQFELSVTFTNNFNNGTGGTVVTIGIPIPVDETGRLIVPPSPSAPPGLNVRIVNVYLPEGYNTSSERYPVIYYCPGLGGDATSFVIGNKFILDNLISQKLIVPMIVVNNDPSLINGPTDHQPGYIPDTETYAGSWYVNSELNGRFEDFIVNNTIDFIDANFRTKASFAYRGIMGQSMGGYGAFYLGMKHPEKFIGWGSCSATSFWALVTTILARPPDGNLFTINSLIQPEIPTTGPNAGKIAPSNGGGFSPTGASATYSFFSYSAAFSPNISKPPYFVDLPFLVNSDGTPVYGPPIPYIGANPITGDPITFPNGSLVLDQAVVDLWIPKDPYHLIDVELTITSTPNLRTQNFYFDAGDLPDDNVDNRGARIISEKLAQFQVDHEYVLFEGGHVDCLVTPLCSRHQTIFQMLSAVFSENGEDPNVIRSKIVGTGTIIIEQNAAMEINKGTLVGIETLPNKEITSTNITLQLNDNGKVLIGTDNIAGGGLQIGNLFSKAKVFGNPSLATNSITSTITIDGPEALFQIGEQGFLGLGVGLVGQFPMVPNDWGMSSLFNATQINLNIVQGIFEQKQIASGLSPAAAVLALGPCGNYTFHLDPLRAHMLGGGNLATIPDGWRLQPVNITDAGILFPNGVRNVLDTTEPVKLDTFYKENIASTGFYTNDSFRNLLSSTDQLDNRGNDNPFDFSGTVTQFTDYLAALVYIQQIQKEGAISDVNGAITIGYLDIINTQTKFVRTTNIPLNPGERFNLAKVLADGVVGIWVETINGQRTLINVYDALPGELAAG